VGVRPLGGSTPVHRARSGREVMDHLLAPTLDVEGCLRDLKAVFADMGIHEIAMMEGITPGNSRPTRVFSIQESRARSWLGLLITEQRPVGANSLSDPFHHGDFVNPHVREHGLEIAAGSPSTSSVGASKVVHDFATATGAVHRRAAAQWPDPHLGAEFLIAFLSATKASLKPSRMALASGQEGISPNPDG